MIRPIKSHWSQWACPDAFMFNNYLKSMPLDNKNEGFHKLRGFEIEASEGDRVLVQTNTLFFVFPQQERPEASEISEGTTKGLSQNSCVHRVILGHCCPTRNFGR